jgi:hypothetical protein
MNDKPYSWTVEVVTDPDTGELMLPFPPDLLSQMGWSEGTDLSWIDNENGTYTIKKKTETPIINTDDDVGC